jgi:amino acid transporter
LVKSSVPCPAGVSKSILAVILFLTYGNLLGVKEAGKAFALPTYLFVGAMAVVFIIGIYRELKI